jgi:hypothetical protein
VQEYAGIEPNWKRIQESQEQNMSDLKKIEENREQRQTVQEESGTPGKESGKEPEQSQSLACLIKGR